VAADAHPEVLLFFIKRQKAQKIAFQIFDLPPFLNFSLMLCGSSTLLQHCHCLLDAIQEHH
jgi:hypothetical protein